MKSLIKKREMTPLEELRNEMDRIFDDMVPFSWREENGKDYWTPSTDMIETEDAYMITVDLPGANKNDIKISVQDHRLTVSGERREEKKEEKENYLRRERYRGSFLRTFTLPESVREDKIKAGFENGVLEIRVPKSEKTKPKTVQID